MQKTLIAIAIAGSSLVPFVASAHNVYDVAGTAVVSVIPDDVFAARIAEAASRNTLKLLHLAPGQSYTSAAGVTDTCPAWFPQWMGCVWTVTR